MFNLQDSITGRLIADFKFKIKDNWLQEGTCPKCNKKELYARADKTYWVKCGRLNKCGYVDDIKDLYADLFTNLYKKFPPSTSDVNATANAYMLYNRGISSSKSKKWYRQGTYNNPSLKKPIHTVIFDIADGVYMERFISPAVINGTLRRANFVGSYSGMWWQSGSDFDFKKDKRLFLVEGCIDAISLILSGFNAVATLSCGNFPAQKLQKLDKKVQLIWALDNDNAGKNSCKKHMAKAFQMGFKKQKVALISQVKDKKNDWNDAYIKYGKIDKKFMGRALYLGDLFTAKTPLEKALLISDESSLSAFSLFFSNRTYWFSLGDDKNHTIKEIANCRVDFLYYQVSMNSDESKYYAKITNQFGAITHTVFLASHIATGADFHKKLLSTSSGSMFTGSTRQLNNILRQQLPQLRTIKTIDYMGYEKTTDSYIFNDIAVCNGEIHHINDKGFFQISNNFIKLSDQAMQFNTAKKEAYKDDWFNHFYTAFSEKGVIALSFWIGTLFAAQIRERWKSYPFLEIMGEPGAGKSTLLEFMWKLVGISDYEGFDPAKSTKAGVTRKFNQVSNLPVVLLEADRESDVSKYKKFDWDELKTAYNGRLTATRGMKTMGNETYEPAFKGAIIISQNTDICASRAILERVIKLNFDCKNHTNTSRNAARFIESCSINDISYFLIHVLKNEKNILEYMQKNILKIEQNLFKKGVKNIRIAKNYSQIISLMNVLKSVVPITDEQLKNSKKYILKNIKQNEIRITGDGDLLNNFWDTFEYLDDIASTEFDYVNLSSNENQIAINLNRLQTIAFNAKQNIADNLALKRNLKNSVRYKFVKISTARVGKLDGRIMKLWIFSKKHNNVKRGKK